MITNISKSEIEHIKKNLGRFPYRGIASDLAKALGRKRQNIHRSIKVHGNIDLCIEIKRRADKRIKLLQNA